MTLAYLTMKKKAAKRKRRRQLGSTKWEPEINEEVLLKCQPTSDAALGITAKFTRPFDGPWVIYEYHSTIMLRDIRQSRKNQRDF
jgi:hypothetical protein